MVLVGVSLCLGVVLVRGGLKVTGKFRIKYLSTITDLLWMSVARYLNILDFYAVPVYINRSSYGHENIRTSHRRQNMLMGCGLTAVGDMNPRVVLER